MMAEIHRSVLASKRLEKLAQLYENDTEVIEKIAEAKIRVDNEIFEMTKKAGAGWEATKRFFKSRTGLPGVAQKSLVGGAAAGVGLGLPTYMVGSGLLEKGREQTEATAADIRNKVLQTALGVGGIGAGMYGLSKLMGKDQAPGASQGGGLMGLLPKFGSDENAFVEETLEKLAAIGTIEGMLDSLPENVDDETKKLAMEIRMLNHSYGVHLLHGLYPDDV